MTQEETIVGKHILVGLAYMDRAGEVKQKVQTHGTITRVEEGVLYLERADGGGEFSIPCEGELEVADPGATYTLESTGEKISGIDFTSAWEIHPPDEEGAPKTPEDG